VRLYNRNANDWTARLAAIAAAAELIKAKSFTIDGEAVVLGPDGSSRFEELSRHEAARTRSNRNPLIFRPDQMARTCAVGRFLSARLRWRDCCSILRLASC
jgi:hypothetical protein